MRRLLMWLRCRSTRRRLGAYCDGELTPSQGERVRDHLAGCAGCAAERRAIEQAAHAAARVRDVHVPRPALGWEDLCARLGGPVPARAPSAHVPVLVPITAAAAFALALGFGFIAGRHIPATPPANSIATQTGGGSSAPPLPAPPVRPAPPAGSGAGGSALRARHLPANARRPARVNRPKPRALRRAPVRRPHVEMVRREAPPAPPAVPCRDGEKTLVRYYVLPALTVGEPKEDEEFVLRQVSPEAAPVKLSL